MLLVYLGCLAPSESIGLARQHFHLVSMPCTDVTIGGKISIRSLGAPESAEADQRFRDVRFCLPAGSGAIKFGCVGASMRRKLVPTPRECGDLG
jgi:hypothetical protein